MTRPGAGGHGPEGRKPVTQLVSTARRRGRRLCIASAHLRHLCIAGAHDHVLFHPVTGVPELCKGGAICVVVSRGQFPRLDGVLGACTTARRARSLLRMAAGSALLAMVATMNGMTARAVPPCPRASRFTAGPGTRCAPLVRPMPDARSARSGCRPGRCRTRSSCAAAPACHRTSGRVGCAALRRAARSPSVEQLGDGLILQPAPLDVRDGGHVPRPEPLRFGS
jgi:hypothetical protein